MRVLSNLSDNANLAKLNGTGPQVFTGNNDFTGSGNGSSTYGALFENATNSTTAFAVQNAAGISALSINTSSASECLSYLDQQIQVTHSNVRFTSIYELIN